MLGLTALSTPTSEREDTKGEGGYMERYIVYLFLATMADFKGEVERVEEAERSRRERG